MLTRKAGVKPGDFVLVHAGGSGVSIAAIQIAKLLGATVATTVGEDWKIDKARAIGADHVINYRKADFRAEIKKIRKAGCDIVVDHVGETTFNESLKCLVRGGKLVSCGATSGANVQIDMKSIFFKNLSILGSTMGSRADLVRIVQLVKEGKLKPVIDSTFTMDRLADAHAKLESRAVFGKVAVTA
jgi:NADPH:quinone reductase-like Zn-dependent oxidoreductase